jgi:branched-chain amino acid transport system permease protein
MFVQQVINGLTVGSVYALIALGYTMVYGIIELINFAHGEIYMIGAYLGIIFLGLFTSIGLTQSHPVVALLLTFVASALFCGAYGVTMERIAYKPLRHAPRLAPLISALGVSIFLQNYVMLTQGAKEKIFPQVVEFGSFSFAGATMSNVQVMILTVSAALMLALHFFINRTTLGTAMRATAQDKEMAQLVGINVNRVISITFAIGSILAAAAGVMISMYYTRVYFYDGYIAGIKAFTAAVLGGIGNIPGAMLGGLCLGMVESFGAGYISAEYKDVFSFGILVLILILKPSGLLGEELKEK